MASLFHREDKAKIAFTEQQRQLRAIHDRALSDPAIRRHWNVIGSGPLGAKAGDLLLKTNHSISARFEPNRRVVLAMGFFDGFYEKNSVLKTNNPEKRIRRVNDGSFSAPEMELFMQISAGFKGTPIAIRSSAHGDCKGTGTYTSTFYANSETPQENANQVANAVKRVVASQFTEDAVAFRKDAGLQEGMAVIIERVIGQPVDDYSFAPNFSGFGYTHLSERGGFVKVVAGMPTGAVQSKEGEKFVAGEGDRPEHIFIHKFRGQDSDLKYGRTVERQHDIFGEDGTHAEVNSDKAVRTFETKGGVLLRQLENFGELCGNPQYVEWTGVLHGGNLRYTLLQTADIEPKVDYFEFPKDPKNVVFSSSIVTGSGQIECDGLVIAHLGSNLEKLAEFNKKHRNYVLAYNSELVSQEARIPYSYVNNASVIIDYGLHHAADPISHWKGQLDATKHLFLVVDELEKDMLDSLKASGRKENVGNLSVYDVKLRVTASERMQEAVVQII
ncbi:MAG: PEP/pyruvate-binding domain-containing protein [Nitrospirota bacterium]